MSDTKFFTLKTDRLTLKPVSMEHANDYKKHFVNYNVIRTLSDQVPWPYPEDGVKNFIKDIILPVQGKTRWLWGLFLKENEKELIGAVDLWREGKPENRGFWLSEKYWGRGLMTEASSKVTDFAFENLGFEKLTFANACGNKASSRIKEKAGCRLVSVEKANFVDPSLTEHEIWELTKEEWTNSKKNRFC